MILYSIPDAIILGFGIYTIFWFLLTGREHKLQWDKLDEAACVLFSIGGLLLLGRELYDFYWSFDSIGSEEDYYALDNRMFGPYWVNYWLPPLIKILLSQALWFKKISGNRGLRITVALLVLLPWEWLLIFIYSMSSDYLPSTWGMFSINNTLAQLPIFLILLGLSYWLRLKLGKKKD